MKGTTFQITELIKIIIIMLIFASAVILITYFVGGGVGLFQLFCQKNPTWCGELPQCVCCEVLLHKSLDWPLKDIYGKDYLWTTEEECVSLIKENDGRMFWKENDPRQARCGKTPNSTVKTGILFHDYCKIPEQYVSDIPDYCICCQYEAIEGVTAFEWLARWMCEDIENSNIVPNDYCGYLSTMPPETRKNTLLRIGKWNTDMATYCEIPPPYNDI